MKELVWSIGGMKVRTQDTNNGFQSHFLRYTYCIGWPELKPCLPPLEAGGEH